MKTIKISETTYSAITEAAILPFRSTAKRMTDGGWLVPVEDDVHERLRDERLPGETDDDTIQRMIHVYFGRPTN